MPGESAGGSSMSGNETKQAAFGWSLSEANSSRVSSPRTTRPEAPPRAGAGDARGASPEETNRDRPQGSAVASGTPLPPDSELWDVRAAARYLKRSVSWVYHKAEDGTLPVKRLGGWGIRFIPGELRAWVATDNGGGRRGL